MVTGGAHAQDRGLVPVRIALQWLPQSQFAGFYMARDQGYFREAGLDVQLLHAGPGPSSLDLLRDDKADVASMFLADAIAGWGKPLELVNIAQVNQRSSLMLVAWKAAGIEKPEDLNGRRVSIWSGVFSESFTVFFRRFGIDPVEVPQHRSVNLFLRRGVAACAAMEYNEYHLLYQAGVNLDELTVFRMRDYGLGFPEDGLYAPADFARLHPEACRAVREATIKGWQYAREQPEEAIDAVIVESRRAGVPANRSHSRWMLTHVLESIFPADAVPGRLERAAFETAAGVLREAGEVDHVPPYDQFVMPLP